MSNGGPRMPTERTEEVMRLGRLMYGSAWKQAVAEDLGIDSRTLRRWIAGEGGCGEKDLVWLRMLARRRATRILEALGEQLQAA